MIVEWLIILKIKSNIFLKERIVKLCYMYIKEYYVDFRNNKVDLYVLKLNEFYIL